MSLVVLIPILALIALVPIAIIVIRKRLCGQALLAMAFIGAIVSAAWGFVKLADDIVENDTAGAILVGCGLVVLLLGSVAIKQLYRSRPCEGD